MRFTAAIPWQPILIGLTRSFWLVMLFAHVPALLAVLSAGSVGDNVSRLGLLLGANTLFLLKVLDVAWLRLPQTRQAWLVAAALVALLHVDVARRHLADTGAEPAPVAWHVTLIAVVTLSLLARGDQRQVRERQQASVARNQQRHLARFLRHRLRLRWPAFLPRVCTPAVLHRGPPARFFLRG